MYQPAAARQTKTTEAMMIFRDTRELRGTQVAASFHFIRLAIVLTGSSRVPTFAAVASDGGTQRLLAYFPSNTARGAIRQPDTKDIVEKVEEIGKGNGWI